METFQKKINSDIILLSLGLFVVAFGIGAVFLIAPVAWFVVGIGAILAASGAIWGKRRVTFSDEGITTQYLTKQVVIPWSEVVQSKFEVFEKNHSVHLDLRNGKKFSLGIERKEVPKIQKWIDSRATLNPFSPSTKSSDDDWFSTLLDYAKPVFVLGLGVFLAWISFRMCMEVYNGSRASGWPTTDGLVTSSNVDIEKSTSGRRIKRTTTHYKPVVTYEYTVDGKQYEGKRISFSPFSTTDRNEAYQLSHDFITNPEINVRHDSANPTDSVLLTGVETQRKVLTGLMILGSLAAIGFGSYHLMALRQTKPTQGNQLTRS